MKEENVSTAAPAVKTAYLVELRRRLADLPDEEREAALTYYREYFDDAGAENAERVLLELGAVHMLAEQILSGYSRDYSDTAPHSSSTYVPANPEEATEARRREEARREEEKAQAQEQVKAQAPPPPPPQQSKRRGGSTLLIIVLVILALPLLIPLAITVFAVGFGLAATAFGLAVAVGAVVLCLLLAGIVLLAVGFSLLVVHTLDALVACGVGLALLGISTLLLLLFIFIFFKILPALIRLTVRILRWPFERRAARA
ncbi:MAG: hypothetical protein FWF04_04790 [Clostridiales bacterium]|nr:hypothetical protein [Clostridiales bacterium]